MYKQKAKKFPRWILVFLIAAVIFGCNPQGRHWILQKVSSTYASLRTHPVAFKIAKVSRQVHTTGLSSPHAILIDPANHTILLQKNSDAKIYPASLTKMMTAIVAIENLPDLNEKVTLNPSIFPPLYRADASLAGFSPRETVRVKDLLYGALLPSGAECSVGLADQVAGSEQKFTALMNQKARQLGMKHTHFANATGLQNREHYSTVQDLAKLLCYALQNRTFRKIFTTHVFTSMPTRQHPDGVTFQSTLFRKLKNPSVAGGKILGGKTGFTNEAGLCLASLAEKKGKEYIFITVGAKVKYGTEPCSIRDACKVYNAF